MTILYWLQTAFTVWMLVDCIRRRAEVYWYVVTLVPFGAWVYFFAVKIHDFDLSWLRRFTHPPPSLEELRWAARETPSFANRMRLAEALHDADLFTEAAELFEEALRTHPGDLAALHGLGLCKLELGDHDEAIAVLTRVVDANPAFRDHRVCLDLADALGRGGRDDDALDVLRDLARSSPTVPHRVALATRLAEATKVEEARDVARRALDEYRHSPPFIQRRDRAAAREAEALLDKLGGQRAA